MMLAESGGFNGDAGGMRAQLVICSSFWRLANRTSILRGLASVLAVRMLLVPGI
jgi:hypothetical protein